MADDLNPELLNSPENIHYEKYDFPVVEDCSSGYGIAWRTFDRNALVQRLIPGIQITRKNAEDFAREFEVLCQIHDYPDTRLDWIKKGENYSLECIMPDAGGGVWMYIYSGIGDHAGTPMEQSLTPLNRLSPHNIDHADTAIFLVEGLAQYLQLAGISFPHIETTPEGTHTTESFSGRKMTFHNLSYSFRLPYEPLFNYLKKLAFYAEQIRIPLLEISEKRLAMDEENFAELKTMQNGEQVWIAERVPNPAAVAQLFSLLSKPLKWHDILVEKP